MSIGNTITKGLKALGKNNNPAYVVVAIATAKGICRPLFTMMDKKESPETKKYAALREGLTEVIAIPTYITCGALAGKGAHLVKDPKQAEMAKHNLRFLGVCAAALVVIPGLCSLVIKPFTDMIFHKGKNKDKSEPARLDVTSKTPELNVDKSMVNPEIKKQMPLQSVNFSSFTNTGMRVG